MRNALSMYSYIACVYLFYLSEVTIKIIISKCVSVNLELNYGHWFQYKLPQKQKDFNKKKLSINCAVKMLTICQQTK